MLTDFLFTHVVAGCAVLLLFLFAPGLVLYWAFCYLVVWVLSVIELAKGIRAKRQRMRDEG